MGPLRQVDVLVTTPGGQRVAVEADGPSHFIMDLSPGSVGPHTAENSAPNGATRLRDWELARRGIAVVSVPIWWVQWRQGGYELRGRYSGDRELRNRVEGAVAEALQWRPARGAVRGRGRLGLTRVKSPILLPAAAAPRRTGARSGARSGANAGVEAAWDGHATQHGAPSSPRRHARGGGEAVSRGHDSHRELRRAAAGSA